jgi:TolA-binding protein
VKKQNFVFIIFCLCLTVVLIQVYWMFDKHFSPEKEQLSKIAKLNKKVEVEKLKAELAQSQFLDYQQQVATLLQSDKSLNVELKANVRSIASVTEHANGVVKDEMDLSSVIFERGRDEFKKKNYKKAAVIFGEMIEKFSISPLLVRALFFRAESFYLDGNYEECLEVVDQMMAHYPDNELTGFIMLRMGQIFESRERKNEALEVYRVVVDNFQDNADLKKQAGQLARKLE